MGRPDHRPRPLILNRVRGSHLSSKMADEKRVAYAADAVDAGRGRSRGADRGTIEHTKSLTQ